MFEQSINLSKTKSDAFVYFTNLFTNPQMMHEMI